MPSDPQQQQIPARYIGGHSVLLSAFQGPFRHADGTPLESLLITRGDTLMLGAREVLGASYKFDPTGQSDPLDLGVGRVVLPDDAELSAAELTAAGYEFHEGRSDFEPLRVPEGVVPIRPPVIADAADAPVANGVPDAASDEGTPSSSAAGADQDADEAGAPVPEAPADQPPRTEAPASSEPIPEPAPAPEAPAELTTAAADATPLDSEAAPTNADAPADAPAEAPSVATAPESFA